MVLGGLSTRREIPGIAGAAFYWVVSVARGAPSPTRAIRTQNTETQDAKRNRDRQQSCRAFGFFFFPMPGPHGKFHHPFIGSLGSLGGYHPDILLDSASNYFVGS